MKAVYNITINFQIFLVIEETKLDDIKKAKEMANDISQMVADEATRAGGVCVFNILKSKRTLENEV